MSFVIYLYAFFYAVSSKKKNLLKVNTLVHFKYACKASCLYEHVTNLLIVPMKLEKHICINSSAPNTPRETKIMNIGNYQSTKMENHPNIEA